MVDFVDVMHLPRMDKIVMPRNEQRFIRELGLTTDIYTVHHRPFLTPVNSKLGVMHAVLKKPRITSI